MLERPWLLGGRTLLKMVLLYHFFKKIPLFPSQSFIGTFFMEKTIESLSIFFDLVETADLSKQTLNLCVCTIWRWHHHPVELTCNVHSVESSVDCRRLSNFDLFFIIQYFAMVLFCLISYFILRSTWFALIGLDTTCMLHSVIFN